MRAFGAWYELFPRSWGGFARRRRGAARARRARLRRRLPAAGPPDRRRRTARAGTTPRRASAGRPGQPVGDRRPGGRPRRDPSRARHAEATSTRWSPAARKRGHRDRARLRDPVLARPPVADRASGVVQPPARRHAQVRREPAEALPGHLQRQLRLARTGRGSGRRCATSSLDWCRARRPGLPGRQPAHEVGAVLGVADRARCAPSIPETIFLAEAFTRPAMMTTLAKVGFASPTRTSPGRTRRPSWSSSCEQLLAWSPFYRPNFFANTPDILHEYLQEGGRPAFEARLVLAATLSPIVRHLLRLRALRERARARRAARSTSTRRSTR